MYTHSETFGSLTAVNEEIQGNLTSAQYLHTLDFFLWQAVAPIVYECPEFFESFIVKCVSEQALKPNTKFSSGDKDELPALLFQMLTEKSAAKRYAYAKKMLLNRGLLFGVVALFLRVADDYVDLRSTTYQGTELERLNKTTLIEMRLQPRDARDLYATIKQVQYWQGKALSFKSNIVQKYTRMAMLQAQRTYVDFNHFVPLDDVSQVYLMIVNKAIDRCDARLGVLTTFIQRWLASARGIVARMANMQTFDSLDSLEEEFSDSVSVNTVEPDRETELIQQVSYIAQQIDPEGLVRISLNIPQYLEISDRKLLESKVKDDT